MNPHTHFLFPFFIALILNKINLISIELVIFCGVIGVVIDIDHYIKHIIHSKKDKFSLIKTWNMSEKFHKYNQRSFIHYKKGALIVSLIILILSFINWKIALITTIGYYSHLLLDNIHTGKTVKIKILNILSDSKT